MQITIVGGMDPNFHLKLTFKISFSSTACIDKMFFFTQSPANFFIALAFLKMKVAYQLF